MELIKVNKDSVVNLKNVIAIEKKYRNYIDGFQLIVYNKNSSVSRFTIDEESDDCIKYFNRRFYKAQATDTDDVNYQLITWVNRNEILNFNGDDKLTIIQVARGNGDMTVFDAKPMKDIFGKLTDSSL